MPGWLEKWASLVLEYVAEEQRLLPEQLLALPPALGRYTLASAAAEAKGAVLALHKKVCRPQSCEVARWGNAQA